jgi:hypothetical protein
LTPLKGGSCALKKVFVGQCGQSRYYAAHLSFSNGQKFSVPIYVPFEKGSDETKPYALQIAQEIGNEAAKSGEINVAEWILKEKVPFLTYLRQQVSELRNSISANNSIQFRTQHQTFKTSSSQNSRMSYCITIFDGAKILPHKELYISVPPDFSNPDMIAFLDRHVDNVLGFQSRRHQLKSSARLTTALSPETIITGEPTVSYINPFKLHNAGALFTLPQQQGSFACSLGTRDNESAMERLEAIQKFIREALKQEKKLTIAEVQEFRKELVGNEGFQRRKAPHRGPVIIYEPKVAESDPPKEALRLYTALFGTKENGHVTRLYIVPPYGGGKDKMYSTDCYIPANRGLTPEEADTFRMALRSFFERKLTAFFQAGGSICNDKDTIVGKKFPLLTPKGVEKLHSILEGRLNTDFINAAMKAGFHNPFDDSLSPNAVFRFGGMRPSPQPANSQIRLLNTREVTPKEGQSAIRSTLVFSGLDGRELFRCDLQLPSMDQLVSLIGEIDDWTTRVRTTPDIELPVHVGRDRIRNLTQQYLDARQQNSL